MYGIAVPKPGVEDALEVLQGAHRRIEAQLACLEVLPAHLAERGLDAAAREAARFTLRFFETTAADHERDEEECLFPLLRRRAAELERAEISAVINEIQSDHATLHAQWQRLRRLLEAMATGEAGRLVADDVSGFAWLYRRHIEKESAIILPFAREALGTAQCAALAARMRARQRTRV